MSTPQDIECRLTAGFLISAGPEQSFPRPWRQKAAATSRFDRFPRSRPPLKERVAPPGFQWTEIAAGPAFPAIWKRAKPSMSSHAILHACTLLANDCSLFRKKIARVVVPRPGVKQHNVDEPASSFGSGHTFEFVLTPKWAASPLRASFSRGHPSGRSTAALGPLRRQVLQRKDGLINLVKILVQLGDHLHNIHVR